MRRSRFVAICLLSALMSSPVLADAGDQVIRFGLQWVSPTGDLSFAEEGGTETIDGVVITIDDIGRKVEADDALGVTFDYEYLFTDLIGLQAGIGYAELDVSQEGSTAFTATMDGESVEGTVVLKQDGDITMMPLTVGANFHVKRTEKVDFYLGPQIAYVFYDDLKVDPLTVTVIASGLSDSAVDDESGGKVKIKDDFAFGAILGIDVRFGDSGWMFSTGLNYLTTAAEVDESGGSDELDIDPWSVRVGVGKKF